MVEYRRLGNSGLQVSVLNFGTATFGGQGEFFKAWGNTSGKEAQRLVDICLDAGVNFFDTANGYSNGLSEEILGETLKNHRTNVIISTKATFSTGTGPNDRGSGRYHLLRACEDSLRRLKTDHIDLYYMHGFDACTPVEETLRVLDDLISAGKVRYIGCSNFSGWHLMKSLSLSEKYGLSKYVAHQVYYSLIGREFEWELMPLAKDQGVGSVVWSPLAGGALTGKIKRNQGAPKNSRVGAIDFVPFDKERLFDLVDGLETLSKELGKSIPQIALNWLLRRPTVSSLVIGSRNEEQLKQNLGALDWKLTDEQMKLLNDLSSISPLYPYWHQAWFPELIPPMI